MKKKKLGIVASSVAAIAVCTSMVVGSTYALFTSESKVDITVTAGKVSVVAEVGDLTATTSLSAYTATNESKVDFENGGFASVTGGKVTLERVTPGDTLTFPVTITNDTNVNAKYRLTYTVESGYLLASGLDVQVGEYDLKGKQLFATDWENELKTTYNVAISLPAHTGEESKLDNLYQGLSTAISFKVEAVQGNANVTDGAVDVALPDYSELKEAAKEEGAVKKLFDKDGLSDAVKSEKYIVLTQDTEFGKLSGLENVTIDADGHELIKTSSGMKEFSGRNITLKNAVFNPGKNGDWGIFSRGSVTYTNCVFNLYGPYIDSAEGTTVCIEECTFNCAKLQLCPNENGGILPDRILIKNNVFYIDNKDAGEHAIVIGGGEKEQWEATAATLKEVTIYGNTFKPLHKDNSYIAYYVYVNKNVLLDNITLLNEDGNTFEGTAKYAVNSTETVNQHDIKVTTVKTYGFTDADAAVKEFCPDCYKEHTDANHATHDKFLNIHDGKAYVEKKGAWEFVEESAENGVYKLSYDIDLSGMGDGSYVVFNCSETTNWSQANIKFQRTDGQLSTSYGVAPDSFSTEGHKLEGNTAHVVFTFAKTTDSIVMTVAVNGVQLNINRWNQDSGIGNIAWSVYDYNNAANEESLCALTNMEFTKLS